ncbi:MAG TPA: hypothetical protein VFY57_06415 [Rubrobacteraceae bacterium]|nr:hypothetical protein [Rubrobacteraceae bacterium]
MKSGLMAPERLKGSAREGFGRTAIAYVVLLVALVLTVLAFYYVGRTSRRASMIASRRSPAPPSAPWTVACRPT